MQCYQFQMAITLMKRRLAELGLEGIFDDPALADCLSEHDVTSPHSAADVMSLVRNLQHGLRRAA